MAGREGHRMQADPCLLLSAATRAYAFSSGLGKQREATMNVRKAFIAAYGNLRGECLYSIWLQWLAESFGASTLNRPDARSGPSHPEGRRRQGREVEGVSRRHLQPHATDELLVGRDHVHGPLSGRIDTDVGSLRVGAIAPDSASSDGR
jgi:hypothetical protein